MPPDMKDSDSHIPSPSKPKIGYVDPDLSVDGSSGSVGMLGIGTTEGLSPSRYRCYHCCHVTVAVGIVVYSYYCVHKIVLMLLFL